MKNCAKLGNTQRLRKKVPPADFCGWRGGVEFGGIAAFLSSLPISLSTQQSAQPNHAGSPQSTEYYDCSSEREQTAFTCRLHVRDSVI